MQKIKIHHRFDRPTGKGIICDPSLGRTQQSFKDECDINNIVEMYCKTGLWGNSIRPAINTPMFGDFTEVPDFVEAQRKIAEAGEMFDALPVKIRKRFNHDPVELLKFVADEANTEEAIALGIAQKRETPVGTITQSEEKK